MKSRKSLSPRSIEDSIISFDDDMSHIQKVLARQARVREAEEERAALRVLEIERARKMQMELEKKVLELQQKKEEAEEAKGKRLKASKGPRQALIELSKQVFKA